MDWVNSPYVEWPLNVLSIAFAMLWVWVAYGALSDPEGIACNESHVTEADVLLLQEQVAGLEETLSRLRRCDV